MFVASFLFSCLVALILSIINNSRKRERRAIDYESPTEEFNAFQRSFLLVALLAWFSDWLQGAYIYDLYRSYGFTQADIAKLFVVGFLSSMSFGPLMGAVADKYGRRNMCAVYALLYIASCFTKLFNHFQILAFGRILGGVATSLLFTVFEAWMVCEHRAKGFSPSLLSSTLNKLTSGNGLIAVAAGLVANGSTALFDTPLAPFIVACFPLIFVFVLCFTWDENYGNQNSSVSGCLKNAWSYLLSDRKIIAMGLAQSLFEAGMYVFVFAWTVALRDTESAGSESVQSHLGIIFSTFMMCTIIGSNLTVYFMKMDEHSFNMYDMALITHMLATISLTWASITSTTFMMFVSFLLFEIAVGMFNPVYSMMKSKYIKEEVRSSVMNFFRIPLNAFVALALVRIAQFSSSATLHMSSSLQVLALGMFIYCRKRFILTDAKEAIASKASKAKEMSIEMRSSSNT